MLHKPRRKPSGPGVAKDLWINPRSNLRGPDGNRAWDTSGNITLYSGTRFLELADIALGIKKLAPKGKKAAAAAAGDGTTKPKLHSI